MKHDPWEHDAPYPDTHMKTKDGQTIIFHKTLPLEEALILATTEDRNLTPDEVDDVLLSLNSQDRVLHVLKHGEPKGWPNPEAMQESWAKDGNLIPCWKITDITGEACHVYIRRDQGDEAEHLFNSMHKVNQWLVAKPANDDKTRFTIEAVQLLPEEWEDMDIEQTED